MEYWNTKNLISLEFNNQEFEFITKIIVIKNLTRWVSLGGNTTYSYGQ